VSAGGSRCGTRKASGPTAARTRLKRLASRGPGPPEPGALRLLARAFVDLAVALERQEEDERWTR